MSILLSLLILIITVNGEIEIQRKLFQAQQATIGQFPYVVALKMIIGAHFCTGSIIGEQWILTAAHCLNVMYSPPENFTVIAGTIRLTRKKMEGYAVDNVVVNPGYIRDEEQGNIGDIGLVKIKEKFHFSKLVEPIQLGLLHDSGSMIAVGWGRVSRTSRSPVLRYVEMVNVQNSPVCVNDEFRICAKSVTGRSAAVLCSGDSGGPLVDTTTGKLVGVNSVSWAQCEGGPHPDGFIRMEAHDTWIKSYVKDAVFE